MIARIFFQESGGRGIPAISQRGVRKRVKSLWERDFYVKRQGAHFCACFFRHFGHENPGQASITGSFSSALARNDPGLLTKPDPATPPPGGGETPPHPRVWGLNKDFLRG